ncbi:DUF3618 domain-containing protein [Streptomyces minutiscleroticus]|uniref:DUF3618 domain-containing protein n=1 Tax=Streptomyces minutiscleroticus TaxID=68238 RepID=A0A918KMN3_9ACTN|nr:DUF3618 domain-containing protein [Streptomyces minutiscleroticus]GGX69117.1 hypothetical protein GCM10010358_24380 [Streptomyces minutiscleroticus]
MGTTPDRLRQDTDTTRAHLAQTADQLAERVSPPRVVRRQAHAARHRLGSIKERVMGTVQSAAPSPSQLGDTVHDTAEQLGQQARQAPEQLRRQAEGNPLAAGLIAFGTGLLVGSLFPATPAEERMGQRVRERSGELVEPAKETLRESAQEITEELREPARQAASSVKDTAQEAARSTTRQARQSGQEGAQELRRTGEHTAEEARNRAKGS